MKGCPGVDAAMCTAARIVLRRGSGGETMIADLILLIAVLLLVPLAVVGGWLAMRHHRRRARRHRHRHRIEL